jgi:hypothetical protein
MPRRRVVLGSQLSRNESRDPNTGSSREVEHEASAERLGTVSPIVPGAT